MFKSLANASLNLFSKPETVEYPNTPLERSKGYRGLIEYGESHCVYCLKCENACPPGAILFTPTDTPSDNPKNKKSLVYNYNPHLCIYCGECVRACPKTGEALWQSEKKPWIGTKENRINDGWFEVEKQKILK